MIFGKHINRYYRKCGLLIFLGLVALVVVDYLQLEIPKLYQMVLNGINDGYVLDEGVMYTFDLAFLAEHICFPMLWIILIIVAGRFAWRIWIFPSPITTKTTWAI